MPKINQNGPTYFGQEGLAENARGELFQQDPTATPEDIADGKDYRGDVRPKTDESDARTLDEVRADGQGAAGPQVPDAHAAASAPVEDKGDKDSETDEKSTDKGGATFPGNSSRASSTQRGKTSNKN
jgi:hypothetical protein